MARTNIPQPDPDEANRRLNLGIAMFGLAEQWKDVEEEQKYDSSTFGPGWEEILAPTKHAERPRAVAAAYHRKARLLVIAFRPPTKKQKGTGEFRVIGPSPWVVYTEVDLELWEQLRDQTNSTGEWLKYSGIEMHYYTEVTKQTLETMVEEATKG